MTARETLRAKLLHIPKKLTEQHILPVKRPCSGVFAPHLYQLIATLLKGLEYRSGKMESSLAHCSIASASLDAEAEPFCSNIIITTEPQTANPKNTNGICQTM